MARRLFASRWRGLLPTFIFFGMFFVVPIANAQVLVQCGLGEGTAALGCQFCDLIVLVNNIIKFLVFIAMSIAAILFCYAGFLFFTAAGSEERVGKAKNIFKDVVIGFIITLIAYVAISTLLNTLAKGALAGPSWSNVQCVSTRLLGGGIGSNTPGTLPAGGVGPGGATVNPTVSTGDCSPAALGSVWGSNAGKMSCVIQGESGCQNIPSGTDRNLDGQAFSWGIYQINLTANKMLCPGQAPLDCPSAYLGSNYGSRLKPDAASQALFIQCRDAANNQACSTMTAQDIFARQQFSAWSAYSRGNCAAIP